MTHQMPMDDSLLQKSFLDYINGQIDPIKLINVVGYRCEQVQELPSTVKCFCPLHQEEAFRSLIIDKEKKSFKCVYRQCAGFRGGTLLDLYAHHSQLPVLEAAVALAPLLEISLPEQVQHQLVEESLEMARSYVAQDQYGKAEKLLKSVVVNVAEDVEVLRLLASVQQELGLTPAALDSWLRLAQCLVTQGKNADAHQTIDEHILPLKPATGEQLQQLALLFEQVGEAEKALECYQQLIELERAAGQAEYAVGLYEKMLSFAPDDVELHQQLAELHLELERPDKATEVFWRIFELYREQNHVEGAEQTLQRLVELNPKDDQPQERLAELYAQTGRTEQAEACWLTLAEKYKELSPPELSFRYLTKALELNRHSIPALQLEIELLLAEGREEEAEEKTLAIAEELRKKELPAEAISHLKVLVERGRESGAILKLLFEIYAEARQVNEAINAGLALLTLFLQQSQDQQAEELLGELLRLRSYDLEFRLQVVAAYKKAGRDEKARTLLNELFGELMEEQRIDEAMSTIDKALALFPDDQKFLQQRIELLLAQDQTEEGLKELERLAELQLSQEQWKVAERTLTHIQQLQPESLFALQNLLKIFQLRKEREKVLRVLRELLLVYEKRNESQKIKETCKEILAHEPESIDVQLTLAEVSLRLGERPEAASNYQQAAELFIKFENYANAQLCLEKVCELEPEAHEPALRLAEVVYRQESGEAAFPFFARALQLRDAVVGYKRLISETENLLQNYPELHLLRSELASLLLAKGKDRPAVQQLEILFRYLKEQQQAAGALRIVDQLLSIVPEHPGFLQEKARLLLTQGQKAEAMRTFHQVASLLSEEQKWAELQTLYQEILEIDAENETALSQLAELKERENAVDEALALWERLAEVREREGVLSSLAEIWKRIVQLDPSRYSIKEKLGLAFAEQGETAAALELLLESTAYYREQENFAKAVELLERARQLVPQDIQVLQEALLIHRSRGELAEYLTALDEYLEICRKRGDLASPGAELEAVLKSFPDEPQLLERVIDHYHKAGDTSQAVQSSQQLAELLQKRQRPEAALEVLERALSWQAELPSLRQHRVELYLELKQPRKALDELLEVIRIQLTTGAVDDALQSHQRVKEIAREDLPLLVRSLGIFIEQGQGEQVKEESEGVIERCHKAQAYEAALELSQLALKAFAEELSWHKHQISSLLSLQRIEEAISTGTKLARSLVEQTEYSTALEFLELLKPHQPADFEFLELLKQVYLGVEKKEQALDCLWQLSQLAQEKGELSLATEKLKEALAVSPSEARFHKELASLYQEQGEQTAAREHYEHLFNIYKEEGNLAEAEQALRHIAELDPEQYWTQKELAHIHLQEGNLTQARHFISQYLEQAVRRLPLNQLIQEYRTWLAEDSENLNLRSQFAHFLKESGLSADALEEFLSLTEYAEAQLNDPLSALQFLQEAIELSAPPALELRERLGNLYLSASMTEEAFGEFVAVGKELVAGNPERALTLLRKGYQLKKDSEELLVLLSELSEKLEREDQALKYNLELLEIRREQGRTAENIPTMVKILDLNPSLTELRDELIELLVSEELYADAVFHSLTLGEQLEAAGKAEEAVRTYQRIKEFKPEEIENRRRIVKLLLDQKQQEAAIKELESLGELCLDQQQNKEAERCFRQVLEIDPSNIRSGELLGKLYEAEGNFDKASKEYQKVVALYREQRDLGRACEVLERIRKLNPGELASRRQLFELYLELHNPQTSEEGLATARLALEQGDQDAAEQTLRSLSDAFPDELRLRRRFPKLWLEFSCTEQARDEYQRLVQAAVDAGKHEEGLELVNESWEHFPHDKQLWREKIRALGALERQQEAYAEMIALAHSFEEDEELAQSRSVLEEAIMLLPEAVEGRQHLIAILEKQGEAKAASDQLFALADLLVRKDESQRAIETLQEVLRLNPSSLRALKMLAGLYQEGKQVEEAAKCLLEAARILQDQQDLAGAIEVLEQVLQGWPDCLDALVHLAHLYQESGKTERALTCLLQLGHLYQEQGELQQAVERVTEALRLQPKHIEALCLLFEIYEAQGVEEEFHKLGQELVSTLLAQERIGDAVEYLGRLEKRFPDQPDLLLQVATLHQKLGEMDKAVSYLRRAAALYLEDKQNAAALVTLQKLAKLQPQDAEVKAKVGRLLAEQGETERALEAFAAAAGLFESRGDKGQAVETWKEFISHAPERVKEREHCARLLMEMGEQEQALTMLLETAESLLGKKIFSQALSVIKRALEINPADFRVHQLALEAYQNLKAVPQCLEEIGWLADYHAEQREFDPAEVYLKQGIDLAPSHGAFYQKLFQLYCAWERPHDAEPHLLRYVQLCLKERKIEEARLSLERWVELFPQNVFIHQTLYDLYRQLGEEERAREQLITLLSLYMEEGAVEQAEKIRQTLLKNYPLQYHTLESLASLYQSFYLVEKAQDEYLQCARLASEQGDKERALEYAHKAYELEPGYTAPLEILVELYEDREREKYLRYVIELAQIRRAQSEFDEAVQLLQRAIEKEPEHTELRQIIMRIFGEKGDMESFATQAMHLSQLYLQQGEAEKAIEIYKQLLERNPDDTRILKQYIELYSCQGNEEEIVPEYLRLSRLYSARGASHEAMETLEKLLKITPQHLEGLEEYAELLLRAGQQNRALQIIEQLYPLYLPLGEYRRAIQKLEYYLGRVAQAPALYFYLSDLYLFINSRGKALEVLRQAAEILRQQNDPQNLRQALEKIIQIRPGDFDAQFQLIELLGAQGETSEAKQLANQCADLLIKEGFLDLAVKVYRLVISFDPYDFPTWENLFETHMQLGAEEELLADYKRLAHLYYEQGELKTALSYMHKALNIQPNDLELRQHYIDTYLQTGVESELLEFYLDTARILAEAGKIDEAMEYYEKILQLEPQHPEAQQFMERSAPPVPEKPVPEKKEPSREDLLVNYQNILKLNPNNVPARLELANILERIGEEEQAFEERKRAAQQLVERGELPRAIQLAQKLLEEKSEDHELRLLLSRATVQLEAFKAIESAIDFLEKNPPQ